MKKLLVLYIILTIIKLFTARIDFQVEEAPYIVLKANPTITNVIKSGEDSYLKENWDSNAWYANEEYVTLFQTHGNSFLITVYDIVILAWWILSIILLCFLVKKIYSKHRKKIE